VRIAAVRDAEADLDRKRAREACSRSSGGSSSGGGGGVMRAAPRARWTTRSGAGSMASSSAHMAGSGAGSMAASGSSSSAVRSAFLASGSGTGGGGGGRGGGAPLCRLAPTNVYVGPDVLAALAGYYGAPPPYYQTPMPTAETAPWLYNEDGPQPTLADVKALVAGCDAVEAALNAGTAGTTAELRAIFAGCGVPPFLIRSAVPWLFASQP